MEKSQNNNVKNPKPGDISVTDSGLAQIFDGNVWKDFGFAIPPTEFEHILYGEDSDDSDLNVSYVKFTTPELYNEFKEAVAKFKLPESPVHGQEFFDLATQGRFVFDQNALSWFFIGRYKTDCNGNIFLSDEFDELVFTITPEILESNYKIREDLEKLKYFVPNKNIVQSTVKFFDPKTRQILRSKWEYTSFPIKPEHGQIVMDKNTSSFFKANTDLLITKWEYLGRFENSNGEVKFFNWMELNSSTGLHKIFGFPDNPKPLQIFDFKPLNIQFVFSGKNWIISKFESNQFFSKFLVDQFPNTLETDLQTISEKTSLFDTVSSIGGFLTLLGLPLVLAHNKKNLEDKKEQKELPENPKN